MGGEDHKIYVALFRDHPLGPRRFTKDFRHNLTMHNKVWWMPSSDKEKREHFAWALNHEQYHYSTDDINKADWWYLDKTDAEDRAILEEFAPVDFIEVEVKYTAPNSAGWQQWFIVTKEPIL